MTRKSKIVCNCSTSIAWAVALIGCFMVVGLFGVTSAVAGTAGQSCVKEKVGGNPPCTANDVRFGAIEVISGPDSCILGDEITVTMKATIESGPDRYDVGLWINESGGSAKSDPDGTCYRDYLPPPLDATTCDQDGGPYFNGELAETLDTCGDVYAQNTDPCGNATNNGNCTAAGIPDACCTGAGTGTCFIRPCSGGGGDCLYTFRTFTATFECADSDGDGTADVGTCTSWDNQVDENCTNELGTDPGTGSKCSCTPDDAGIPVGNITICGNGTVEGAEECDPGAPTAGDCCNDSCQFEAVDTTCDGDGLFCTSGSGTPGDSDTCNATGTCTAIPVNCDDGAFCNGTESCNEGSDMCDSSGDPCGDDGAFCNGTESCDEGANTCNSSGDPCGDDGAFCNGTESCDEGADTCDSSGDPCGDDGEFCNGTESCDEGADTCASSGDPCGDDGAFCNGTESCDEGANTCNSSGDPCGDDGEFCNGTESCDEGANTCNSSGDPCGDDGAFCNGTESCDEGADTCDSSGDPCGDDGAFCNGTESCDEGADTCASSGDPCGDDGAFCNGTESCDEGADTCDSSGDPCGDDGEFCNGTESCDEGADTCDSSGDPCSGDECNTCQEDVDSCFDPVPTACGSNDDTDCNNPDTCDGAGSCVDNFETTATECSDGLFCTSTSGVPGSTDNCNGQGNGGAACVAVDADCNDGEFCSGTETCNDTTDTCDSSGDPCGDDGAFCNGTESCDEGADTCDSSGDPCGDDGAFCNGTESCDEGANTCNSSGDPCGDDGEFCNGTESCDEGADTCDSSGDPCSGDECNTCQEDVDSCFDPAPTACGSNDDTDCNNPDTCDGAGSCVDNFETTATECSDGLFCTSTSGVPGSTDNCNGQGNGGAACVAVDADCNDGEFCSGTETCNDTTDTCDSSGDPCGDDGAFCNGTESCDEGADTCDSSGDPCSGDECNTCQEDVDSCFDPAPTACGSDEDTACNNPDTCDGAGSCVDNFETTATECSDGLFCTSTSGVPGSTDNCNGQGNGDAACVAVDADCNDGTFCNGTESCDEGTDTCDSSGDPCSGDECNTCQEDVDSCFDPAPTACGSDEDTACNNPDTCDGAGSCVDNFETTATECSDGLFCTSTSGVPGTTDNCNGQGNGDATCVAVDVDCNDGEFCSGDETCNDATDTCDSSGDPCSGDECNTCQEDVDSCFDPAPTACGSNDDTACNNPDTCDGAGSCVDNFETTATECSDGLFCTSTSGVPGTTDNCNGQGNGDATCVAVDVDCNDGEFCSGTETCNDTTDTCDSLGDPCSGDECNTCQEDLDGCFDPQDTPCGSDVGADPQCNNPDTCNGAGNCLENFEPAETACSDGDPCTSDDGYPCAGEVCDESCGVDACNATGACVGIPIDTDSDGTADCGDQVEVFKRTLIGGVPYPLEIDWNFSLTGDDVDVAAALNTQTSDCDMSGECNIDFGGFMLAPDPVVYTVCENAMPAGWSASFSLNAMLLGSCDPATNGNPYDDINCIYNPNALDSPPQDLGTRCVDFSVACDLDIADVSVTDTFPGGCPRTIGFWKNWNTCTGGGQEANAIKNGGPLAGWFLLDDLLPQTVGDLDVDTCERGKYLLDKREVTGRHKKKSNDAAYDLASQLTASLVNLSVGSKGIDPAECDGFSVIDLAIEANELLACGGFDGSGGYWPPKGPGASSDICGEPGISDRTEALSLSSQLDAYNNGVLCGGCN